MRNPVPTGRLPFRPFASSASVEALAESLGPDAVAFHDGQWDGVDRFRIRDVVTGERLTTCYARPG